MSAVRDMLRGAGHLLPGEASRGSLPAPGSGSPLPRLWGTAVGLSRLSPRWPLPPDCRADHGRAGQAVSGNLRFM